MHISNMENRHVAILGMGREGRAVWRHIRQRYPNKPLSLFSESMIDEELAQQLDPLIDEIHIEPLDVTKLSRFDLLVRSAGISIYREELTQLRSMGVQFTTACNLWFEENPQAKTICISGSLGKSTTSSLVAHLLGRAGVSACLAGNIGRPMLDCNDEAVDWWVIELSSYQISDLVAKPDIVVLLNICEEHLDWHRGFENYKADKLRIAQLASDGTVIANYSDPVLIEKLCDYPAITWFNKTGTWQAGTRAVFRQSGQPGQRRFSDDESSTMNQEHVDAPASLPGEHNMQNLAAALTVLDALGLDCSRPDEALSSFSGLPHRLQPIGVKDGISYVDDSISTTPFSVAAALQTLGNQDIVLLLGGMDRGLDWSEFAADLADRTPYAIVTMPDNGQRIFECLKASGIKPDGGLHATNGLREAVVLAQKLVPEEGCILLSPGAPSFPNFRDYEDRGQQFARYSGF